LNLNLNAEIKAAPKVGLQVKSAPKPVVEVKIKEVANIAPAQVMSTKTISAQRAPATPKKAVPKLAPIAVESAGYQENPPENVAEETASWENDDEGLSVATVELNTKQLGNIEY